MMSGNVLNSIKVKYFWGVNTTKTTYTYDSAHYVQTVITEVDDPDYLDSTKYVY